MKRINIKFLVILILLSILITSCGLSAKPTVSEPRSDWLKNWLSHPTCRPPCWENITPGMTSIDDAATILTQVNGVKITRISPISSNSKRQMDWLFDQTTDSASAFTDNQGKIISDLYFGFNEPLSIEEVISAFGPPTNLLLYDCRTELSKSTCAVHIIFNDKGMALQTNLLDQFGKNNYQINIEAKTQISGIWFFPISPDSYENIIGKNSFNYPEYYFNWNGYSNYP